MAFAAHYIGSYKVYLDPDMIRNVLETDPREASELVGSGLVLPLLGLAVLPIAALWRLRLRRRPLLRATWMRLAFLVAMLALAAGSALFAYQDLSARSEEHTSELQSLMRNSYAGFCLKTTTQPTAT